MKYKKHIFSALSFVVPFIIYCLTLAPDLMFTDSGELAGVCVNLGVAHSTGYPLFTILGHIWSLIPLGIPKIMQMNLFSAFATALGSFVFFFVSLEFLNLYSALRNSVGTKLNDKKENKVKSEFSIDENVAYFISLISSLVLAFGKTIWSQATSIEVYSLQIVFFNLIILLLLKTKDYNNLNKIIIMLSLVIGLGFSNHMNTILIIPTIFWIYFFGFSFKPDFNINKFKNLLILIIPFIIGLSFYLYLPLRSQSFPDFNWGWVHRSWDKFFYHVSGKQYQIWMFSDSDPFSTNLGIFFNNLPFELALLGLLVISFGIFKLFKVKGLIFIPLILIVSCLFYSLNYSIHDIDNYFILAYIGLLLFFVIGLVGIFELLKNQNLIYSFLIIPLLSIFLNYQDCNESKNNLVPEYTNIMISNLEKDAIVISRQWDYFCSAFWYKSNVEGVRKDIILIEKELLRRTWYLEQLRKVHPEINQKSGAEIELFLKDLDIFESSKTGFERTIQQNFVNMLKSFIDKNIDNRPIYITLDILQDNQDFPFLKNYNQIPAGFAIKLEKGSNLGKIDLSKIKIDKFINSFKNDNNHLEVGIKEITSNNITNLGNYAFFKLKDSITAVNAYELALRVNPDNSLANINLSKLRR